MNEQRSTILYGREVTLHSQPETNQDAWVIRTLRGKQNGTFLEIGAYDGVYHSNTLTLEQSYGWDGWLIEAERRCVNMAGLSRKAIVVDAVVAPTFGVQPFYLADQWGGLSNYMRTNLLEGHLEHSNPIIYMFTETLTNLVKRLRLPPVVDYLSIDIEGAEFPVLRQYFNRPTTHFRCMTIEVGTEKDDLDNLYDLLEPHGYQLAGTKAWESYWTNPRLLK